MLTGFSLHIPSYQPNAFHRLVQKLVALRPASAVLARTLHHLDPMVLRSSHGRYTATTLLTGLPVVWLTTTGRRSGEKRTTPLVGVPDGDRVVLVASNFGGQHHPGWYYNLLAEPRAFLAVNGHSLPCTACECAPEDYDRIWAQITSMYSGYAAYARRAGSRRIPLIILTEDNRRDSQH